MNADPRPEAQTLAPPAPAPPAPVRPPHRAFGLRIFPDRRRWKRLVAWGLVLGLVASLPLAIELALPRIVDVLLRKEIGYRLSVGRVELDLLGGPSVVGLDVALHPLEGGPPVVTCERIEVVLGGRELARGIVVDRVLVGPIQLRVDRDASGRWEPFARIAEAQERIPKTKASRWRVGEVLVPSVRALVVDHRAGGEVAHVVELSAYAKDLGAIRPEVGDRGPGKLWISGAAPGVVDRLRIEGALDLEPGLDHDLRLDASVQLDGIEAVTLAPFVPALAGGEGRLGVSLGLDVVVQDRRPFTRTRFGISDLVVEGEDRGQGPRLGLERLEAELETAPGERARVRALRFRRAAVPLERTPDGALTLLGLRFFERTPPEEARDGERPDGDPEELAARLLERLERALARPGLAGEPPEADASRARGGGLAATPELPLFLVDELELEEARLVLRDRATPGEPELVLDHVTGLVRATPRDEQYLPSDPEARTPERAVRGHVEASMGRLVRSIALDLEGTASTRRVDLRASLALVGIRGRALDPWLSAGGSTVALEEGIAGLHASIQLARGEPHEPLRGRVALEQGFVVDDHGAHARLDRLSIPLAIETRGTRTHVGVGTAEVDAWIRATRARDGLVTVAGVKLGKGRAPRARAVPLRPREPGGDVTFERLDARVVLALEDRSAAVASASAPGGPEGIATVLEARATVVDLALGRPGVAAFRIEARSPGTLDELSVSGRALASVVTPAALLDVRIAFPRERAAGHHLRAWLLAAGWESELEARTLQGRFAVALDRDARPSPGNPSGPDFETTGVVRVQGLALRDPTGIAASVSAAEVRVRQEPASAVLDVPLVSIRGSHLDLRAGEDGLTIARAFHHSSARPEATAPAPYPERPERRLETIRIARLRVDDGSISIHDRTGRRHDVEGMRARGGPLEIGPAAGKRPLELEVEASAPGVARTVRVTATLTPPVEIPRVRALVDVSGLDLELLRELLPEQVAESRVHAGSLRGAVELEARPLRDGALAGGASLTDLVYRDDGGAELFGVTEVRARILRFDPATGDLDVGTLDLDRPRVRLERDRDARVVVGGVVMREPVLALSDEEYRLRLEGKLPPQGRAKPLPPPPEPRIERTAAGARPPRVAIEHLTVAGGEVQLVDHGALDERGEPFRIAIKDLDATAEHVVLGAPLGLNPTTRYELEARFDDGMRLALDGVLNRHPAGFDGKVEAELHGLDLPRVSRYAVNAAQVQLERGYLDAVARVEFLGSLARGEAELVAHRLRLRRVSDNPLVEGMTRVAVPVLTDWEGDTQIRVPFRSDGVSTGELVAEVIRAAILDLFGQPLKIPSRFAEFAIDRPVRSILRDVLGQHMKGPVQCEAIFAPGDPRLTIDAAEAIASAVELVKNQGGKSVRIYARCGPGDSARATRSATLPAADLRALIARLEAERRTIEDERRDLAAGERRALLASDLEAATAARTRLIALEERLGTVDRSLEDLSDRAEVEGEFVVRGRAEEALRRLATERLEAVRRALVAAGVEPDVVRTRPVRVHHARDFATVPGGGGRVTIEVIPGTP